MKNLIPKGWHSRSYLPHFDGGEILQFVTLHLGDALPQEVLTRWKLELECESKEKARKILFWRAEKYIDQGFGKCWLRIPEVAEIVQNALLHFDKERYKLISWVVMPNHTYFLLRPAENIELEKIMHSIKSFAAQKINKLLKLQGKFWQEEYFDRFIRNRVHFEKTINYIEQNPVKAKLCESPSDWQFSSAFLQKS